MAGESPRISLEDQYDQVPPWSGSIDFAVLSFVQLCAL